MKNRERRRIQQVIITLGMVLCLGGCGQQSAEETESTVDFGEAAPGAVRTHYYQRVAATD